MRELKKKQHQDEIEEIIHQRNKLNEAYKSQIKHLEEREKEIKNELKLLSNTTKKK